MIKEDVKLLLKKTLKETFSDDIEKIIKIDKNTYYVNSNSFFILLKTHSIIKGMSKHFKFFNTYHFGDKCIIIENDYLKDFIKKFDELKKKKPTKASVLFIDENNDIYMVSPSFILEFKERYGTIGKGEDGKIFIFVPTVLLNKINNDIEDEQELKEKRMIQIIQDINSIPYESINDYDDDINFNLPMIPELYLDTTLEEKNEYLLRKIDELEKEIKKLKESKNKRRRRNGNKNR
ncbi:MAG: hypothetical protein QMD25_04250 [Caldisericia bacterium]|jgi:hypothetical protein|nr:hypothetical protein [Caldisericia bacterium]